MLEGKAVQASAIEHLGKASPRLHIRLRRPLLMVPRMSALPLNSLPAIRVDARRAMRSLTPGTARGSPTIIPYPILWLLSREPAHVLSVCSGMCINAGTPTFNQNKLILIKLATILKTTSCILVAAKLHPEVS